MAVGVSRRRGVGDLPSEPAGPLLPSRAWWRERSCELAKRPRPSRLLPGWSRRPIDPVPGRFWAEGTAAQGKIWPSGLHRPLSAVPLPPKLLAQASNSGGAVGGGGDNGHCPLCPEKERPISYFVLGESRPPAGGAAPPCREPSVCPPCRPQDFGLEALGGRLTREAPSACGRPHGAAGVLDRLPAVVQALPLLVGARDLLPLRGDGGSSEPGGRAVPGRLPTRGPERTKAGWWLREGWEERRGVPTCSEGASSTAARPTGAAGRSQARAGVRAEASPFT